MQSTISYIYIIYIYIIYIYIWANMGVLLCLLLVSMFVIVVVLVFSSYWYINLYFIDVVPYITEWRLEHLELHWQICTLMREMWFARHDTSHPIASIYGDVGKLDEAVDSLPEIEIWGINAYRGISSQALKPAQNCRFGLIFGVLKLRGTPKWMV